MDPNQVKLYNLTHDQKAQIAAALGPIMAEILDINAQTTPIAFSESVLRKFGEHYELSVNFWTRAD